MVEFTAVDAITEKLNRADQHIKKLNRHVDAFLDAAPNRELVDYDAEAAKAFRDFDHLVCALILKDGGAITQYSQFPICFKEPTEKDQIASYERLIKGIQRTSVLTRIENLQPWKRGNGAAHHWLYTIKLLSNRDKHQALVLHSTVVQPRIRIETTDGKWDGTYEGPDDGTEPTSPYFSPGGDLIDVVKVERRLTAQIAFREFGKVPRTIEVVYGLTGLWRAVHAVFSDFGLYL